MVEGVGEQVGTGFPPSPADAGGRLDGCAALGRRAWLLSGLGFAALALAVYWPALEGGFIGDDWFYIVDNPFIVPFTAQTIVSLFEPAGAATFYVVNYAPLHLLAHSFERAAFGPAVVPYHVVNILVHVLASGLLIALLRRSGVSDWPALVAGLFFLLHPANVEAVAWISQLKTNGSMALALGALLCLRQHPAASALLFGLALLTKASALFALPMAVGFVWSWRLGTRHWLCVGAWAVIFGLYAVPEFAAFAFGGQHVEAAYQDPWVQIRSVAAIGARYLVMAATSFGVSTLQGQRPVLSWLDPWWLVSLPLGLALAWRTLVALKQRRTEAAWWLGAMAGFAPVSQIFPFIYPMADRYLYAILPGLLGGLMLAAMALRKPGLGAPRRGVLQVSLVVALVVCGVFAVRSHGRAALWHAEELTLQESAANYPDGVIAQTLKACEAAARNDPAAAVAALRRAVELSPASHRDYFAQGCLRPLHEDALFLAFVREQARLRIAFGLARGLATQHWLRSRANDYLLLGDLAGALVSFEAALRAGGPRDAEVFQEIEATRTMLQALKRGEPVPQLFSIPVPVPSG